jgi:hypothetical protein
MSLGEIRMRFLIVSAMNSYLNVSSLSVLCLITSMMFELFCVVPICQSVSRSRVDFR